MTQFSVSPLLLTDTVAIHDVVCNGLCRQKSEEETSSETHLVFPYRGVFVRHVGRHASVAEANQVMFFNAQEEYRISHPISGGDCCLSFRISQSLLQELAPKEHLADGSLLRFKRPRLRIDARTQALIAMLRHSLRSGAAETLEAESLALTLARRALGERTSHASKGSVGNEKLVDRAKLVLSSDLSRRWSLAEIAGEVRVSPVYLTQVFQQVEAMPLYQYQLRLRLAKALDLLGEYDDLTTLSADLGFSSHSHFSATFRKIYGRTPAEFQRNVR